MRATVLTIAGLLAAAPAFASSIETATVIDGDSIETMSCKACPPLRQEKRTTYVVPAIAPGTDRVEIRDIGGQKKLLRTEAWLGGSPVVFVSKASDAVLAAVARMPTGSAEGIATVGQSPALSARADASLVPRDEMTTAALEPSVSSSESAEPSPSHNFDGQAFELRLK